MNVRMLPSIGLTGQQNLTVNGRVYSGTPGTAQDVPDFDAAGLAGNGWVRVALSGPTTARPDDQSERQSALCRRSGTHIFRYYTQRTSNFRRRNMAHIRRSQRVTSAGTGADQTASATTPSKLKVILDQCQNL
jgi:hypothetical protein